MAKGRREEGERNCEMCAAGLLELSCVWYVQKKVELCEVYLMADFFNRDDELATISNRTIMC